MTATIVATADLHLDATTNGSWNPAAGMHDTWAEAQKQFSVVIETANEVEADLLVISGDMFQTGRPAAEAVALTMDNIAKLNSKTKIVVAEGNHDQQTVPGSHRTPIDAFFSGHPSFAAVATEAMIYDHDGLKVALMPWLRVAGQSHLADASAHLAQEIERLAEEFGSGPGLFAGHLTLDECSFDSGRRSSEMSMMTSLLEASVPTKLLDAGPWSSAALGHIHTRMMLSGKTRYIGNPYKLSFSESADHKGCEVMRIEESAPTTVEFRRFSVRELTKVDLSIEGGDSIDVAVEDAKAGDFMRFVLDHQGEPKNFATSVKDLEARGVRVEIKRLPRPRQEGGRRSSTISMNVDPREALAAYMDQTKVDSDRRETLARLSADYLR